MSSDIRDADREVVEYVSERDLLVECQGELKVAEADLENLRTALVSARRIGAAIGVLMSTRQLTDDEAFAELSRASQNENRKLRLVAEDVLRTGAIG